MMPITPTQIYHQMVLNAKVKADSSQERVLQRFDILCQQLQHSPKASWPFAKKKQVQGIYLHGKVGRGKTFLMDLFYQVVNIPKTRLHFYAFMQDVHRRLKCFQGEENPLVKVAEQYSQKLRLLCLDEFFVEDIADAAILAGLLKSMLQNNLVIVTTSNVRPADLYREGLQRALFLPAIQLIEQNMQVLCLNHPDDYRLLHDFQEKNYCFPLEQPALFLQYHFNRLTQKSELCSPVIQLHQREFHALCRTDTVIWFEFNEICVKPRAAMDYLSLTKNYAAILLSNLPVLTDKESDAVRRFIALVDTCYDRHIVLIINAEVALAELYQGARLRFEFERTRSRLTEMAGWIE